MGLLRKSFLWASRNSWLKDRAVRTNVIRRAVRRFMPGEDMDAAIAAARDLGSSGIRSILTHLGENLTSIDDAARVYDHYIALLERLHSPSLRLDAQISVKPTQLGYDQSRERCLDYLSRLLTRANAAGTMLWLDMESSEYVDGTLSLYRALRKQSPAVGVALQAYLFRTEKDLEHLLPLGSSIRLVKGAYLEPPSVAFQRKADVDRNYARLADLIARPEVLQRQGALIHVATHDTRLQDRVRQQIVDRGIPADRYEFAMLFGILPQRQRELAQTGVPTRVLISYGEDWFPWYMRRLAERPANVWFVVKNVGGG
jgi:proline dehydrogenase